MSKVWITRTLPAAEKTALAVSEMGFDPVVSPLLKVVAPDILPSLPGPNCLLVFTSKNGVRAFCERTDNRNWPVITVGDATADLARTFGFKVVTSAAGTSPDIIELIKSKVKQSTPIIHCAGETIRVDFAQELNQLGFTAKREVYYGTLPVDIFPDALHTIKYVLFHSPRAARSLRELNLDVSHMTAISISEAANTELKTLALHEKCTANAPTETALLACLRG